MPTRCIWRQQMLYWLSTTSWKSSCGKSKLTTRVGCGWASVCSDPCRFCPRSFLLFRQKYPKVTLDLTERGSASLEELLQKGTIDLVFVAMESTGTNLVYEQLIEQETISILDARDTGIVARIESGPPSPWRMWRETFVPMREGHSIRVVQDKLFYRSGFHPKILLETNTLEVGKRVAVASGACMLMSNIYIDEFIRRKRGEFYPLKDYENYRHLYACHSKE